MLISDGGSKVLRLGDVRGKDGKKQRAYLVIQANLIEEPDAPVEEDTKTGKN